MKKKIVIVQIAPAIRVSLGEELGYPPGTILTKKIVSALKKLGFDVVFDTQLGADLTIAEEAHEALERFEKKENIPILSSCCPAWVYYVENSYPDLINHLGTSKSPQQIMGALIKTYFAKKMNLDPREIYSVSIMPCIVKKAEAKRKENSSAFEYWKNRLSLLEKDSFPDVDKVLTTQEVAKLIKKEGINLNQLPGKEFDNPLGISSGGGTIFGTEGGVAESALRTIIELITKKPLKKIEFEELRKIKGLKTATIPVNGKEIKVAIANGIQHAKILLDEIRENKSPYHFIEVMACQGGCIGGSGQPDSTPEIRLKRSQALYKIDAEKEVRISYKNPAIKQLYQEFLEKPLSKKAHLLLHVERKESILLQ